MFRNSILSVFFIAWLSSGVAVSQGRQGDMPRQDVIDVPALGEGLSVSNVFQTNMVLQRDRAVAVWGWAKAGERVTVSFAGAEASAVAAHTDHIERKRRGGGFR